MRSFDEIINRCKSKDKNIIAVACCHDEDVLKSIDLAKKKNISNSILIGNLDITKSIAQKNNINLDEYDFIDEKDINKCCEIAVRLVNENKANMLMKGLVDTSVLLKAVLNKDWGLRKEKVLSHVAVFESRFYHKLFLVTDAAMNISPDIESKAYIIKNACNVSRELGVEVPKVAVLCAKEKVNPKMKATMEADTLRKMNEDGKISNCIIDGPMALDNAISKDACKVKGINSSVGGDADILLCPDIESGNILYKTLVFLSECNNAGIIVGAKAPIILSSRSDSDESKLNSIALATIVSS